MFNVRHESVNIAKDRIENADKREQEAFDRGYDEGKKAAQKVMDEGIMLTPPSEGE